MLDKTIPFCYMESGTVKEGSLSSERKFVTLAEVFLYHRKGHQIVERNH